MIIESKAPTRVDFAGGTLDIWPLYLFHPGAVTLNAAISLYASCVIETHPSGDNRIKLVSRDIKREESFASFAALVNAKRYRLPLLAEITKFFQPQGGFTLTTDSEAPAGAGIGGSSAMAGPTSLILRCYEARCRRCFEPNPALAQEKKDGPQLIARNRTASAGS